MHFLISADGYEPLTTALYIKGDKYLDSDAVFGARKSLIIGYQSEGGGDAINFDFVIARSGDHASK